MPATHKQTADILRAAYMAEVEFRHRKFYADDSTLENISRFSDFLTAESGKFGAIFCGKCGNGKTTLLYAFRNAVNYLNSYGFFDEKDTGIMIVDAKDIVLYTSNIEAFKSLKEKPMIAIEDMGREPAEYSNYGNVINPLVDLLEYRYNEQLFTLITTNLTPAEIRAKYGARIADRFNEMLEVIIFKNNSYRN